MVAMAAAVAACTKPDPAPAATTVKLSLSQRGARVKELSVAELSRLGAERVTVQDPHEGRAIVVEGIPARALFDAAYGPAWRSAEEIDATCVDGFRPAIAVRTFLEHEGYVAFARPGERDFSVQESAAKRTPVGPYYLVWKKGAGDDPPEPNWPYQVVGLDVTDAATRQLAVALPEGAGALAMEGAERFRTFCLPCHTVNGEGGGVGPELNYPRSVTEYMAGPTLRQWMVDPRLVRWNAKMPPPLPPEAREHAIDTIVAYLSAMTGAKRAPRSP